MSEYETALGYVHDVLRDLQSRGVVLTAPVPILQELAKAGAAPRVLSAGMPPLVAPPSRAPDAPPTLPPPQTAPKQRPIDLPVAAAPATKTRPRPAVPVLPPLPPIAPSVPRSTSGTKAEQLTAWRQNLSDAAATEDLLNVAHPHIVFGTGNPEAELLFIGESPGEEEPLTQDPLTTEAGGILTKMIGAMGLSLDEVYLAQTLRVRPEKRGRVSEHRLPTAAERQVGLQRLQELISIIQPRVLVALGASAVEGLLGVTDPIGKVRSQWLDYRGTPLLATYHPAYLVRNQAASEKRKVWTDMLLVLEKLGRPITDKQRGFFLPK